MGSWIPQVQTIKFIILWKPEPSWWFWKLNSASQPSSSSVTFHIFMKVMHIFSCNWTCLSPMRKLLYLFSTWMVLLIVLQCFPSYHRFLEDFTIAVLLPSPLTPSSRSYHISLHCLIKFYWLVYEQSQCRDCIYCNYSWPPINVE